VVCRELNITQRTLQRWLKLGFVQEPLGKLAKNRRGWTPADIELLKEQLQARSEELKEQLI
jgi:DNA-binding transcriptional MerR regulator